MLSWKDEIAKDARTSAIQRSREAVSLALHPITKKKKNNINKVLWKTYLL